MESKTFTWTLENILKNDTGTCNIEIPPIQRSLVWNATQIEMFWDSIMRGIPIGVFTAMGSGNNTLFLLDGQQRYNAIKVATTYEQGLLWFDPTPSDEAKSAMEKAERKFLFRFATLAHPWGYKITGGKELQRLSTAEKRLVVKNKKSDNDEIDDKLWHKPKPAECRPYGLSENAVNFSEVLNDLINTDVNEVIGKHKLPQELEQALANVQNLKIPILETGKLEQDDLDIFFRRMNHQGTPFSNEELQYSMLKSTNPEFKTLFDKLSSNLAQPARLANLAIQIYLTRKNTKWTNGFTNNDILELKDDSEFTNYIALFKRKFENINCLLDPAFNDSNTCRFIPSLKAKLIASNQYNDIFKLLMLIAYQNTKESKQIILGLTTLLMWFATDRQKSCEFIYKHLCSRAGIRKAVKNAISAGYIIQPIPFNELPDPLKTFDMQNCRFGNSEYESKLIQDKLDPVWNFGSDFVDFTCGLFLDVDFPEFSSSSQPWQDENRPWDYDHIFPKKMIHNQTALYKYSHAVAKFCWFSGNCAPIPFTLNREKSKSLPSADYCKEHQKPLYLQKLDNLNLGNDYNPCGNENDAKKFIGFAWTRFKSMYEQWYNSCNISELSESIDERAEGLSVEELKKLLTRIIDSTKIQAQCYYKPCTSNYEYPFKLNNDNILAANAWVSIRFKAENKDMTNSPCVALATNGCIFETGYRKAVNNGSSDWWPGNRDYTDHDHQNANDMTKKIIDKIKRLLTADNTGERR